MEGLLFAEMNEWTMAASAAQRVSQRKTSACLEAKVIMQTDSENGEVGFEGKKSGSYVEALFKWRGREQVREKTEFGRESCKTGNGPVMSVREELYVCLSLLLQSLIIFEEGKLKMVLVREV